MPDITTDNKWKPFKYGYEVPEKVLKEDFDWMDDEKTDGFINYRKCWYHISEFMVVPKEKSVDGWQAISPDSVFSAVLLQVSNDGEEYKIGTLIY